MYVYMHVDVYRSLGRGKRRHKRRYLLRGSPALYVHMYLEVLFCPLFVAPPPCVYVRM
jgi:hypothetical protein